MKTLFLLYKALPFAIAAFFATWHMLRQARIAPSPLLQGANFRAFAAPCEASPAPLPPDPYGWEAELRATPSPSAQFWAHEWPRVSNWRDVCFDPKQMRTWWTSTRANEDERLAILDRRYLLGALDADECEIAAAPEATPPPEPCQQRVPANLHVSLQLPADRHAAKEPEAITCGIDAAARSDTDHSLREEMMRIADTAAYSGATIAVPDATAARALLFTDPALNRPSINWDSLERVYRHAKLMELVQVVDSLVKANATRTP